ncbi:SAM-dependent methyltransferase [Actinomadura kijaniata]|uniref:SAM-dependent methyltransferase n=1 Tax=Actinomadura kijaniata TaxID=46161 RepID=UPI00082A0E62|nr:SAM-dependent methyltransferase [Actinomadura kijaniata]
MQTPQRAAPRPDGVSRTAVLTARARAEEQERADRLFTDPLAGPLAAAAGGFEAPSDAARQAAAHFVVRTRYFDDRIQAACAAGRRQVVLLAAGLDARAFRLDLPAGTRLFELDLPELVAFKEEVLAGLGARARCERTAVPVDLRGDWARALTAAGFDPGEPTAWLVEGLMTFLPQPANDRLLGELSELSAPGSGLALEHVNSAYRRLPQMRHAQERLARHGASWRSAVDDPAAWLAGHGWTATEVTHQAEVAARLGRAVPEIYDPALVGDARIWLVAAERP